MDEIWKNYGYIAGFMKLFINLKCQKMKLFPAIQNQLYGDAKVFLRVIPEMSQHF
jgi:hypothetical protein